MQQASNQLPEQSLQTQNQTVTSPTLETSKSGKVGYKVHYAFPNSPSFSEVRSERNLYKPFQPNPGPGKYESKSYIQDGPQKTISNRLKEYKKMTPGPLDYDNDTTKVKKKAPTLSMSSRYKSQKQLIFEQNTYQPPPTKYEKKGTFGKKNGFYVGTSKRRDLTETEKTPGPFYYKTQKYDNIESNENNFKIGDEERKTTEFMKVEQTPGPAFYEKKHFFQDDAQKQKGFSFRKRLTDLAAKQIAKNPGPGQYQSISSEKEEDGKSNLNQTERKTFMDDMETFSKEYPGPGKHNPNHSLTENAELSYVFSQTNRKPLDEYEKTPGPGYYRDEMSFTQGPSYTISKTVSKNQLISVLNPENPGPGSYESNISSFNKSYSKNYPTKITDRFGKQRYTPGPGSYSFFEKQSGPSYKFASGKRTAFTDVKSAGKSQYESILKKFMGSPKNMSFKQMQEGSVKSSQGANEQV